MALSEISGPLLSTLWLALAASVVMMILLGVRPMPTANVTTLAIKTSVNKSGRLDAWIICRRFEDLEIMGLSFFISLGLLVNMVENQDWVDAVGRGQYITSNKLFRGSR
jgi:hypothetical protein